MPTDFSGTWTSVRAEGWKELLEAMQVPLDKLSPDMKVTEAISQSGDAITITSTNNMDPSRKKVVTFNVGSNFKDTIMGREIESSTAWDGCKLVTKGTAGKGGSTREIVGGEMVLTITAGSVIAKTVFAKQ